MPMREFLEVLLLASLHATGQVLKGFAGAFASMEHHVHTYWQRFGYRHDQQYGVVRQADPTDEVPEHWKKN